MTKEEVQSEYAKTVSLLGEKVYRLFIPVLDYGDLLFRALNLNRMNHQILAKEKEAQEKAPE